MVGFTKNEASTNASPQANIDPRVAAAELKKKLLNDKSVRAKRDNSVGTHGEVFHNTVRPETHSSSHTSATPTPVPHASPPMRTQNSVPANAKELVALIKSISNTTQESQVKTTGNMVEHKVPSGSVGTATANAGASCPSLLQKTPGLDSVPHTSTVKATQSINASISTPTKDGEVVTGGTLPGVVNTPIRSANAKATSPPVEESKTDDKRMTISTPSKPTATLAASHGEASVSPSIGPLQAKKRQDGGTTKDAGSIASWNTYYPSSHLGDLNEADKKNASTILKQPSCTAQARDINNGGASQTVSAKLAKLIEQDQDLRDWLLYTHYFDVEVRKKKLTRYRTLNEMEAAERKIKEEQERLAAARRKLLEEDGHDQSFLLYTTRAGHSQTSQSSAPATPITDVSSNRPPSTKPFGKSGIDAPIVKTSAGLKRVLDINDRQEKYSKMPKLDTEAARNSKTLEAEDERERDDRGRRKDHDRDGLATRCHHSGSYHRSRSSRRHSPFRAPHDKYKKYNHNSSDENYDNRGAHYHEMGRYEAHRGKGSHGDWARTPTLSERYSRLPVTDPKPVNLGGKGETRFFMVKSFNENNVRMCMEDGLWTTQTQNTETLTSAFAHCKNVILFFSINKSGAFQGYARMATAPSPDTPRPSWIKSLHWETSPPFRVEWLSTTDVAFRLIGHLQNPLNNNLPVLVGKDGQEIEEECGRRLLHEMEAIVRSKNEDLFPGRGPAQSPHADRGRGGLPVRSRGGKYTKYEER